MKIKVNETHICVLRRIENEESVKMDFVEMKFKYQKELDELKRMTNDNNCTVLDLQDYVKSTPLCELLKGFNHCWELGGIYQEPTKFCDITPYAYQAELDGYARNNYNGFGRQFYINDKRFQYYRLIKMRVIAYMMQEAYQELGKDPTVLAFSHRRRGDAGSIVFSLNEDLKVAFFSNFGYGMYSYFATCIYYKDVCIIPYSDWVRYRWSNICDYTRHHQLKNDEWIDAMSVAVEMCNAAVANPESFVEKYIINEIEDMLSGLEKIQTSTTYKVFGKYNNGYYITEEDIVQGEDLIRFKGKKISGALKFVENIKKLLPVCDNASLYIERIIKCNLVIKGEFDAIVKEKQDTLAKILEETDKIQSGLENKNSDVKIEKIKELNSQKYAIESLIKDLQSYIEKIESHISDISLGGLDA